MNVAAVPFIADKPTDAVGFAAVVVAATYCFPVESMAY